MLTSNRGRPSGYKTVIADEILERIACGEPLVSICEDGHMPCYKTVMNWLVRGESGQEEDAEYADFLHRYARARELQQDTLMDECLVIADDARNDWMEKQTRRGETITVPNHESVNRSRLRVETRFRMAEKVYPKKYGAKADLNVNANIESELRAVMRIVDGRGLGPPSRREPLFR